MLLKYGMLVALKLTSLDVQVQQTLDFYNCKNTWSVVSFTKDSYKVLNYSCDSEIQELKITVKDVERVLDPSEGHTIPIIGYK